ncbi:prenyltransferase/squalene oxidase repeat-containing protein [Actinopolymorpha singaporensis]|uniref:Squalene-hopene cyclase C-terminal domain-containing protein n=1 Tax=Actinopolymorpha singaporensis TaxID=117157 RepID=A0A1H1UPL2_9ACTN|nr:prenyltransferase/squalene oxidase repeat-containing protein [Actinopolymorpha singaporensis]SDS74220.1 Squalene-hopene cyclase C-terminal domain-containing protein [Actinopolymorpha singaporensis]
MVVTGTCSPHPDGSRCAGAERYRGVLGHDHWLAYVRTTLTAAGFRADGPTLRRNVESFRTEGLQLRDQVFAERLRASFGIPGFEAARSDAYLWSRLPLMLGLGAAQARALEAGAHGLAPRAVVLGAAFNTAISLLDYLVDDMGSVGPAADALDPTLLAGLFTSEETARSCIAHAHRAIGNPLLAVVMGLVGVCAEEGWSLVGAGGTSSTWHSLGATVGELLRAELVSAGGAKADPDEFAEAVRWKSVGPTWALWQCAELAREALGLPACSKIEEDVTALGELFWLTDDLVDLVQDDRCGFPNVFLHRLYALLDQGSASQGGDQDLYVVGAEAADKVVSTLGRISSTPLRRFGRMVVGAWTGWSAGEAADGSTADPANGSMSRGPTAARRTDDRLRSAVAATGAILRSADADYSEAAHHLRFPRLTNDGVRYEEHPAVLSFRAVAVDALFDARDAGLPVPATHLATDMVQILRAKHRSVRGGWNYIADVEELPPDLDDLGQVLQVLSRYGDPALAASCEEGARLASDQQEPDGGINTWIIDPRGSSPADLAVRAYLPVMGGWGVHSEVVANFAAGLLRYDRVRFAVPLRKIAHYLAGAQEADGSWTSKWYAGPYYGTFRAVSVLAELLPGHEAIAHARRFLYARQNPDGSWGEGQPDPLDTALALLGILESGSAKDSEAPVNRGLDALVRSQAADGTWDPRPWIVFPTVDGPVTYGSRTMTTAFALKALVAADRLVHSAPTR